jgi:hypothetical protein
VFGGRRSLFISFLAPSGDRLGANFLMLKSSCLSAALVLGGMTLMGCGGAPGETNIPVPQVSPLDEAKRYLQNYANGRPVTSEASAFPKLVEDVRKVDPMKAELLEKGLAEIQASPATAADKAKDLLSKL